MRIDSLHYEYLINGYQLNQLKQLKKSDTELIDQQMLKLENLLKLMQATGDAPRVDNLNFVNLQVLQSITGVFSKEVQN